MDELPKPIVGMKYCRADGRITTVRATRTEMSLGTIRTTFSTDDGYGRVWPARHCTHQYTGSTTALIACVSPKADEQGLRATTNAQFVYGPEVSAPLTFDDVWQATKSLWPCAHEFVDTGLRKSWCKHCDADAEWDNTTASFKSIL